MSRMSNGTNLSTPQGVNEFEIVGRCPSCGWDGTAFHPGNAEVRSPGLADPVPRGPEAAADRLGVAPESIRMGQKRSRDPEIDNPGNPAPL
jgi:hypothetical protein